MVISREFKVGLFMIVAFVLLYFGFNYLKGIDFFSTNNRYYAVYTNVDKLAPSASVYLNGYKVGRVSDITIVQDKLVRVLVELEIDSDIELTHSTTALLTGDILGDKSIVLQVTPGEKLAPNDTLKSNLDKGMVDFLQENAAPVATNLQTTLGKFNLLVEDLRVTSNDLDTLIRGLRYTPYQINKTLVELRANLATIAGSLNMAAKGVNTSVELLKPTLQNFQTFSDSLKYLKVNETLMKLQTTMASMDKTLKQLQKKDNTVSKLLYEDDLYMNLNRAILNLDTLLNHFDENPKHFLGPLGQSRKKIEREREEQEKNSN